MTIVQFPHSVHFVGSFGTDTVGESFEKVLDYARGYKRVPDGEPKDSRRHYWLQFQSDILANTAGLSRVEGEAVYIRDEFNQLPIRIDGSVPVEDIVFSNLGYAEAAISSYGVFEGLKARSVIGPDVKFQVSLPSPLAVITAFVVEGDRSTLLPKYEEALLAEIDEILAVVPQRELAIQWDLAVEFLYIENVELFGVKYSADWFSWSGESAVDASARLIADVINRVGGRYGDVEQGLHLCYGDVEEEHFVQPDGSTNLCELFNSIVERLTVRPLGFVHVPVPIWVDSAEFFVGLEGLLVDDEETDVYLGLLHREDGVDGALKRIALASRSVPLFGVATECGFGRAPAGSVDGIFELHNIEKYW